MTNFLELGAKVAITSDLDKLKIPHQNWKKKTGYVFAYTM
jgi:hypothetical protein